MKYFVVKNGDKYRTASDSLCKNCSGAYLYFEGDTCTLASGDRRVWLKPKAKKRYRVQSQSGRQLMGGGFVAEPGKGDVFNSKRELWAAVKAALVVAEV